MILFVIGIVASYLIGAMPTAYIIGRVVKGIDIRTCGSGNVGATNVFRSVGKSWGIVVLLIDIVKGFVVVQIVARLCMSTIIDFEYLQFVYGIAAICGHNWTIFLQFKGGKGVATTCGVALGLFPKALGLSVLVFIVVVAVTKYVSMGSMISAVVFPVFLYLFYRSQAGFIFFMVCSLLLMIFIIFRHHTNIKRLLKGEESKITFGKNE